MVKLRHALSALDIKYVNLAMQASANSKLVISSYKDAVLQLVRRRSSLWDHKSLAVGIAGKLVYVEIVRVEIVYEESVRAI